MNLPQILTDYGYLGVFIGTLMEGETVLLLAGFAAHQGYLVLGLVIAVAFVGGTLGDQIAFFLGRRYGNRLIRITSYNVCYTKLLRVGSASRYAV